MKRILIVEDEPDIQELLRAYLEDAGYQTAVAGDGVAALALFGAQPFDLVLLDLMLPKIDGFGVCELIRRQSQVPILMLTALDGEEQQLRGFRHGHRRLCDQALLHAGAAGKDPGHPSPPGRQRQRKAACATGTWCCDLDTREAAAGWHGPWS